MLGILNSTKLWILCMLRAAELTALQGIVDVSLAYPHVLNRTVMDLAVLSSIKNSDYVILHLVLLSFWNLSIVWCSKRTHVLS
jgi:hypothetical protein